MQAQIMARRKTYDGVSVQFWTDGSVTTGAFSTYVRGCGVARNEEAVTRNVAACWLLAGEVSVYKRDELPAAVKTARMAIQQEQPLVWFRERLGRMFPAVVEV